MKLYIGCNVNGEHTHLAYKIMDWLGAHMDCTCYSAFGWYKGELEATVVAEIFGERRETVRGLAQEAAAHFKQESVLFTYIGANGEVAEFIGPYRETQAETDARAALALATAE